MTQVRLWEVISDQELDEIHSHPIPLEERLEAWLIYDISVLDPNLLVIGRQVGTGFGKEIDLLCLDSAGDTVVVELKRGKTPREVTAQVLDYASWVQDLSADKLREIAEEHFGSPDSLASVFQERFEKPLPDELNLNHRSLIVAESTDASTDRIVRYLSGMKVPINVATVQHFKDKGGREILAQVYLVDPEEAEEQSPSPSKRTYTSLTSLQALAQENGIGSLFSQVRNGVRGILSHEPYSDRVWYWLRRDDGSRRTILIIRAVPHEENVGLGFIVHATRFENHLGIALEELRTWLPSNCQDEDVSGWSGSSEEEKRGARGLKGSFQNEDEVEKFLTELKKAAATSRTTGPAV